MFVANVVFRSFFDLEAVIKRFAAQSNDMPKQFRLDRRSRQNHRCRQARAPSVRFDPLARLAEFRAAALASIDS